MKPTQSSKVLVIEDDLETCAILRLYLERDGCEVIEVHRGDDGLSSVRREGPHLVLLDLMLPGLDGWDLCRAIRSEHDVPIMMITARSLEEEKIRGFDLGADDYVVKPFSPREVVRRTRALMRRSRAPSSILRFGSLELNLDQCVLHVEGRHVHLTQTEFRILETLMTSPGRVYSRENLIASLGRHFEGYSRTIDAHIGNLRRKLDSRESIQTVVGFGYRLEHRES